MNASATRHAQIDTPRFSSIHALPLFVIYAFAAITR